MASAKMQPAALHAGSLKSTLLRWLTELAALGWLREGSPHSNDEPQWRKTDSHDRYRGSESGECARNVDGHYEKQTRVARTSQCPLCANSGHCRNKGNSRCRSR